MLNSASQRALFMAMGLMIPIILAGCHHSATPIPSPPVASAATFVGNAICVSCHAAEFRSHYSSRHASTLHAAESAGPEQAPPLGNIPNAGCTVIKKEDGFYLKLAGAGNAEQKMQLVFGSGKTGVTYVKILNSQSLMELRMSYFPKTHRWFITPGQQVEGNQKLGAVDTGDLPHKCIQCHAVMFSEQNLAPDPKFFGVGCEACHGPASAHVQAMQSRKDAGLHIERIGTWPATRINELCGKCHRTAKDIDPATMESTLTNRFQPYGLMQSRCFRESKDTLSCVTCHDPHTDVSTNDRIYEAKCLTCHAPDVASGGGKQALFTTKACPVNPRTGCIGCHMPEREAFPGTAIPTKMADHLITVYGAKAH